MIKIQGFGWRRSLPDFRDIPYQAPKGQTLPSSIDLRAEMPPIWDQGQLGSCTSHAILAAIEYEHKCQTAQDFIGSRLGHYYMERAFEGSAEWDAGAEIRDGIKIALADGLIPESDWPYDISKFAERPPQNLYHKALDHQVTQYQSIAQDGSSYHIRHALSEGRPVIVGFTVFESFESDAIANSGIVPMPSKNEQIVGGHAVLVVGYDAQRDFICRNSWGPVWGDGGYFLMPFDYLCNPDMAGDFWTIKGVE